MSYSLLLRSAVGTDISEAARWYENERRGLGGEFVFEVEQTFERIVVAPLSYPIVIRSVRRAMVRRFDYKVIYDVKGSVVTVVSVVHNRRHPRAWRRRLREEGL